MAERMSNYKEVRDKFIKDWTESREQNRSILGRMEAITLHQVELLEKHEGKIDAGTRDLLYKFFGLVNKVTVDQMKADILLLNMINEGDMTTGSKEIKITREIID
jgi:hypothetical protein